MDEQNERDPRFEPTGGAGDSQPPTFAAGEPGPEAGGEGAGEGEEAEGPLAGVDELKLQMLQDKLRSEQSLTAALGVGLVASLVGALLWAVLTVVTGYQIGWMAVGVGFLVGLAVRFAGKGVDQVYGIVGAVLALLGCLVGNYLSIVGFAAQQMEMGYLEVITSTSFQEIVRILVDTFSPIDLLFYGIAVYEGYKLSFRTFTPEEIEERLAEVG